MSFGLNSQKKDLNLTTLTTSKSLVSPLIVCSNIEANTLNGTSASALAENVDAFPGDNINALLAITASEFKSGVTGSVFLLASGSYPETTLSIPAGINLCAYAPGASFPNLIDLILVAPTSVTVEAEYLLTNIQVTLNNTSSTTSQITLPDISGDVSLTLAGGSTVTSTTDVPIIGIVGSNTVSITLKGNSSGLYQNPLTQTCINATGSNTVNITVYTGTSVNGLINIAGTVTGLLYSEGLLNGGDGNYALTISTTSSFDLDFNYGTIIGGNSLSGTVTKRGVLYDQESDELITPVTITESSPQLISGDNQTYTAPQLLSGVIVRNTLTANSTDVLPSAASILEYLPNAFNGSTIMVKLVNASTSYTIELSATGGGSTIQPPTGVVAALKSTVLYIVLNNVDTTPTYICFV
jgi:hypothetical protein